MLAFAKTFTRLATTVLVASASISAGQFIQSGSMGAVSFSGGAPFQSVTGHPYSAEQVTERAQTLTDGTHISQANQKTLLYRDSAGRTRTEHSFTPPSGIVAAAPPSIISIIDPVAGFRYTLDTHNQVARRSPWPPVMRRNGQTSTSGTQTNNAPSPAVGGTANSEISVPPPHPAFDHQPLGTQTIEGLTATGMRNTVTYPEGSVGNDKPFTAVSETWTSTDLNLVVLSKNSDPRNGETTTKLINVSQTEPDPALFQIPADYSIVDEPQPVAH